MPSPLSSEQVQSYDKLGYLFPLCVLDTEEVTRHRADVEDLQKRLGGQPSATDLAQTHLSFRWSYDLALNPRVLDAVEAVLGPDVLVLASSIFAKYAHNPSYISWHQDATYWGLDAGKVTTAWIALSPSTSESGCMRVVPETQKEEIHPHVETYAKDNLLTRGQEIAVDVDEKDAVDLILKPGEMSLHHVNIIHGSNPNRSDDQRIGFAVRYVTPDVQQQAERQPAILARGEDRHGNFPLMKSPPSLGTDAAVAAHMELSRKMVEAIRKTKGAF